MELIYNTKKYEDLTGKVFNRLTVVSFAFLKQGYISKKTGIVHRDSWWNCKCQCGKEIVSNRKGLVGNRTKSCGCLQKEVMKEKMSVPRPNRRKLDGAFLRIFNAYKRGAKKRNLEFNLDKNIFKIFIYNNCHYCGLIPSTTYKHNRNGFLHSIITYNGIDRKDSSKGYLLDNCVTCCPVCNRAKMDMSYDNFITYINRIKNYNING